MTLPRLRTLTDRESEERALLPRVRAGDDTAFEAVFVAHYPSLYAFAYRQLGTREAAEDVVHSVFRAIWERRSSWEPTAGIEAYLIGATKNAARNVLRHAGTVERVSEQFAGRGVSPGMSQRAVDADEALAAAELTAAILDAASLLAPRCREVFLHRWRDGLTVKETARAMGITIKTAEMHWTRALVQIRERLKRFR